MKRLNNTFTTSIGVILIAVMLLFVFTGKATLTEASGFLTMGLALLFSKDDFFIKNFLPGLYDQYKASQPAETPEHE